MSGDASAEEDAILEELALISRRCCSSPMTTSMTSTPIPGAGLLGVGGRGPDQDDVEDSDLEEGRDAFRTEDMPSPLSLPPVHRPIPMLHHHCLQGGAGGSATPPRSLGVGCGAKSPSVMHQHPRLQALSGSSSGQNSLPLSVQIGSNSSDCHQDGNAGNQRSSGMSRSISDSTLRRAALHLNLNQSVLPSFTSLQQFKVFIVKMQSLQKKSGN